MKPQTLPVKRRPAPKGIFKRLSAVTRGRKQHAAAAATADMDESDGGSKISRALTIIFLFHIVALGLLFVHKQFLDGRPSDIGTSKSGASSKVAVYSPPADQNLPKVPRNEKGYLVQAGDNYARIAAAQEVDENELRIINKQVEICPGRVLVLPPKRIVAVESPEVTAIRKQEPVGHDQGLVEVNVENAPRAQLVHPNIHPKMEAFRQSVSSQSSKSTARSASGKTYVVQPGDSVWRIANHFKVNQVQLMKANGITDAKKVRTGMSLSIP
jgi:LysM repeat protein